VTDAGCAGSAGTAEVRAETIGVSFETLQNEYWVASLAALNAELANRHEIEPGHQSLKIGPVLEKPDPPRRVAGLGVEANPPEVVHRPVVSQFG
jgi:hypothetical protein